MAAATTKEERPASLRKLDVTTLASNEDVGIIEKIQLKIQLKQGTELLDFEFKPMMGVINRIFRHALFTSEMDSSENDLAQSSGGVTEGFEIRDNNLQVTIHKLSWKIICKSACDEDEQEATTDLLELLCSYSLEAKVMLVLAAFAMTYGQFWTNAYFNSQNFLAQSVCLFLKPPCLVKETHLKKLHFDSLKKLVEKMLAVAVLMVDLKELTKENKIQIDVPTTAATLQPCVDWVIRSVYKCFSYNMDLVKMDNECSSWARKITEIKYYTDNLTCVHEKLDKLYQEQAYLVFVREFNSRHESVVQIISMLYRPKDPKQSIGTGSRKVSLDNLKGKTVALFISHWNVDMEDFKYLETTYKEIKEKAKFEILWIPTVDHCIEWNSTHQKTFDNVVASMCWYRLCGLSSIKWEFLRYIQQKWHFQGKPILVVLGDHCPVPITDALPIVKFYPRTFSLSIHMMRVLSWLIFKVQLPDDATTKELIAIMQWPATDRMLDQLSKDQSANANICGSHTEEHCTTMVVQETANTHVRRRALWFVGDP